MVPWDMLEILTRIWDAALTPAALPSPGVALACAGVAVLAVVWGPLWRLTRHSLTIAHEGGHGLVAVLTGRRLAGIRLHSDTSGLTLSVGKPRGFGMILTAGAGYPAPALVGLGAAALVARGYTVGTLWLLVVGLALLLVQIRNWFGLWSILVCAGVLIGISWWAPPEVASAAALTITLFFLLGAPRTVLEMQQERRRLRSKTSDADLLAKLTVFPALFWVLVLGLLALGCLALGGAWLLPAVIA